MTRTAMTTILSLIATQPWPYSFVGGSQPYSGRMSTASFYVAPPVNDPPFGFAGRTAAQIAIEVQQSQPPVWPFTFEGNAQPYMGRLLNPSQIAVPVNDPPFGQRFAVNESTVIASWRPDPWPPIFMGGQQPYAPRRLPADVTAVPENDPPFTQRGRAATTASVIATLQPDPWAYAFLGGKGPYVPAKLSPGIPGQSVENPPFRNPGRLPQTMTAVFQWQPPSWPYTFMGGLQPYQRGNLTPVIINVPVPLNYRFVIRSQTVMLDWNIGGQGNTTNFPNNRRS